MACCIHTGNNDTVIVRVPRSFKLKHLSVQICIKLTAANHIELVSTYRNAKLHPDIKPAAETVLKIDIFNVKLHAGVYLVHLPSTTSLFHAMWLPSYIAS